MRWLWLVCACVLAVGAALRWASLDGSGESVVPRFERESSSRSAAEPTALRVPASDAGSRRAATDALKEGVPGTVHPSATSSWEPADDSPTRLQPRETWEVWEPTLESAIAWYSTVEEFSGLSAEDWAEVWKNAEFRAAWSTAREHQALRHFVVGYGDRERDRWERGETSVALEDELRPALPFFQREFGDRAELWANLNQYSVEAVDQIRLHGDESDRRDDPASMWPLQRALTQYGSDSFEYLAAALRGRLED